MFSDILGYLFWLSLWVEDISTRIDVEDRNSAAQQTRDSRHTSLIIIRKDHQYNNKIIRRYLERNA